MIQTLHAPVTVWFFYDHTVRAWWIPQIIFDGHTYEIVKCGYHFTRRRGRTLEHIFCIASATMFFKLVFDTETLQWHVEELRDHEDSEPAFQS